MVKAHKIKKVTAGNIEQRKISAENLADTYFRLIQTIDTYFQDPITRDEKLNNYYLIISKTVRQLLDQMLIPELNAYYDPFGVKHTTDGDEVEEIKPYKKVIPGLGTPYYEPFSSLLVASYEMRMKKTNITDVLNQLEFFYEANIRTTISPSDKSHNTPDNIKKLDEYLTHVRSSKAKIVKDIQAKKTELVNQDKSSQKIRLNTKNIKFDNNTSIIYIGTEEINLPPYKNEHYFCREMFEHNPKEPISWDIVYDTIMEKGATKVEPTRSNWQKVYDTMKRVNKRIQDSVNTTDHLFTWSEKTIIRNF